MLDRNAACRLLQLASSFRAAAIIVIGAFRHSATSV
jgi:hypothetical protein